MSRTTQKAKCKVYAAGAQLIENKSRNIERAKRQQVAAFNRLMRKFNAGKPVPSRFTARYFRNTSLGNMPNGAHLKKAA